MDGFQKIVTDTDLLKKFLNTRNLTKELIINLEPEDMVVQTKNHVSPTKWHLGHTTWFYEKFLLIPFLNNYKCFSKDFNYVFNSYYNSAGPFNSRDKRGFLNRPLLKEVINYREYVEENLVHLFKKDQSQSNKLLLELGINHEQQHQELMLMDIKDVFYSNPLKPSYQEKKINNEQRKFSKNEFKLSEDTDFSFGCQNNTFCYDNELPINKFVLQPFILGPYITNGEWKNFIKEGGYKSHEFWLSDGWDFINKNNIDKPLYWIDYENYYTLNGVKKIADSFPVSHLSFYEACAFAKFSKKRLPTEFEIEYLLQKNDKKGNFLDDKNFQEIDYQTETNKHKLYGNLWVWTSSNYVPYKNYKPYKQDLMEYNSKFMCNQFVLKCGSFGTPLNHIRSSYRNFYYPSDRWQFCGIRLVEDL